MNVVGLIETFAPDLVSGYCYDADEPHLPVTLDIYVENYLIDTQLANLKRSAAQKNKIPTTRCGFRFKLNNLAITPTKTNTRVAVRKNNSVLGLHTFNRSQGELYPERIDPELARQTRSYGQLIIVNHIPKTAGTSFRLALQRAFKKRFCVYHYLDMTHCDDHIWNWKFSPSPTGSFEDVLQSILERNIRVLFGHFGQGMGGGLAAFLFSFPKAKLVTLVREPFQQTYSYFLHAKRALGISEDFEGFMRQPEHQNIQNKHLEKIPLNRYSVVGIAENYSLSLELIGGYLDRRLSEKFVNANRKRRGDTYHVGSILDDGVFQQFVALNREDFELYNAARSRFVKQLKRISD